MYKITDVVEMGHSEYTGGSIAIEFTFGNIVDNAVYFDIMDHLDHCLVTINPDAPKFNNRYFLLQTSNNLFDDVIGIMIYLIREKSLPEPTTIGVGRGKEWLERSVLGDGAVVLEYKVKD